MKNKYFPGNIGSEVGHLVLGFLFLVPGILHASLFTSRATVASFGPVLVFVTSLQEGQSVETNR